MKDGKEGLSHSPEANIRNKRWVNECQCTEHKIEETGSCEGGCINECVGRERLGNIDMNG
jgi:hypothetical protein